MIISFAWLKEMLEIPVPPEELAEILTFLGLEVEKVTAYRPILERVVIGEIKECSPVQGTDHLSFTRTDVGGRRYRSCAAHECSAGPEGGGDVAGLSDRSGDAH